MAKINNITAHRDREIIRVRQFSRKRYGLILVLTVICLVMLALLGVGLLTVSYGVRHQALAIKNETEAILAAEAGYEQAIFWMTRQDDMLSVLQKGDPGTSGSITLPAGNCDYKIDFYTFVGSRPVYRIVSNGRSGMFSRTVEVSVVQAISGWDMGICRIPNGSTSTIAVNYVSGEIIDMPIHINKLNDNPDARDIYISGTPSFLQEVAMGESRYTASGSDKYSSVMNLFKGGICFDQPDSKVTDDTSVQKKVDRFRDSTKTQFTLKPTAGAAVTNPLPAVQLEFFVQNGVGKVRITNDCTVRGNNGGTYDFRIKPGSGGTQYEKYNIYAYHVRPTNADGTGQRAIVNVDQTYVKQSIGGVQSDEGGQIFVNGNVVVGSSDSALSNRDVVKGKVTVVATGNVWIADSLAVDGKHNTDGKPSKDNTNVLGLIAQGVVKIVDPGLTDDRSGYGNIAPTAPVNYTYVPIGTADAGEAANSRRRHLPDPMVVEAALTVGGGGWGAENVGGRKELTPPQDDLVVRGTIAEAIRGIVGKTGSDGFLKKYYLDERLLEGVLPGDVWMQGKYIPSPAGWHDYRTSE